MPTAHGQMWLAACWATPPSASENLCVNAFVAKWIALRDNTHTTQGSKAERHLLQSKGKRGARLDRTCARPVPGMKWNSVEMHGHGVSSWWEFVDSRDIDYLLRQPDLYFRQSMLVQGLRFIGTRPNKSHEDLLGICAALVTTSQEQALSVSDSQKLLSTISHPFADVRA